MLKIKTFFIGESLLKAGNIDATMQLNFQYYSVGAGPNLKELEHNYHETHT